MYNIFYQQTFEKSKIFSNVNKKLTRVNRSRYFYKDNHQDFAEHSERSEFFSLNSSLIPSLGDKDRSRTTQNRIFRSMLSRHSSGRLDELVALSLSSYRRDIGKRIIIELDRHEGNLLKADRCTDRYLLLRLLDSFLSLDIDSDYFDLSIEFSRSPCPDKSINTSLLLNSYFT